MEYNRIVAVTGLPGLYEILSSKSDGAIVRSLDDKSTKFVSSRIHNLSHLESIEIYTVRENTSLSDVFNNMKNSGEKLPDVKDNKALKAYFEKVYPDLDFERVYSSDMKKMVKWYDILQQNEVDFTPKENAATPEENVTAEAASEPVATEVAETKEAPAKKTAAKKTAAKKATAEKAEKPAAEKAPAKKTAAKKKTEE
jgi:hypothetical protein